METTKICTKCNIEKSINEFTFRKDTQKYRNHCKECVKKKDKEIYYKKQSEILKRKKNHRSENLDKYKEKDRVYYKENSEVLKKKRKKYYKENIDKIEEYRQKEDVKIKDRLQSHFRRCKFKNTDITKDKIKELVKENINCFWCGKEHKGVYHIDHFNPLSKGGTHTMDNIVVSCPSCNLKKNAKDPYEFAKEIGKEI